VRHTSHLFSAFPPLAQTTRTNTLLNEHSSLSINIQVSLGSSLYLVRRLPRRQTARRFRRWRTTRGIRRRRRHRRDASIAGEDWDGAIIPPEITCGGGGGGSGGGGTLFSPLADHARYSPSSSSSSRREHRGGGLGRGNNPP
jgi:hypothetical protein